MGWWPYSKRKLVDASLAVTTLVGKMLQCIGQLEQEVGVLRQQPQELKGRLAQDSHNSHQPPSSDGLSNPKPKSLRARTGRPAGGQAGHPAGQLSPLRLAGPVPGAGAGIWAASGL
jgi:Family of unknown function (DUF6444)